MGVQALRSTENINIENFLKPLKSGGLFFCEYLYQKQVGGGVAFEFDAFKAVLKLLVVIFILKFFIINVLSFFRSKKRKYQRKSAF